MDLKLKRLYEAAYAGNVNSLNELLIEDQLLLDRIITTTEVNDNPLHVAAIRGHADFSREIVQCNPKLAREFNAQGMSPLHLAAAEGHFQVAAELIQVDSDLCYVREIKEGYLPVHVAVIKGRHDIVTLLIEKCPDTVNKLTYISDTLIHLAVKAKRSETVEFLTAHGVTQLMLNTQDGNGNTVLHLAFAGRQQNVINHLLSQADIDVNAINLASLTPLDVLLVSNNELGDIYLGEKLRAAGGKTAKELGAFEIIISNSSSSIDTNMASQPILSTPSKKITKTRSKTNETFKKIEENLIVVAALVATITFSAALNPPGGSIQISVDENNRTDPNWFRNWEHMNSTYPAGSPVYFWELEKFFKYDCFALFASVSVILLSLPGFSHIGIIMKKFLVLVLWCSIYCMMIAFYSALSILLNIDKNKTNYRWFPILYEVWLKFFASMIGQLSCQFIFAIFYKGKNLRSSRLSKFICTPKVKLLIKKWGTVMKALSVLPFVAIFFLVGVWISWAIFEMASSPS